MNSNNQTGVLLGKTGERCWQQIALQPNTEYLLSATVLLDCPDLLHISGCVYFGAFQNNSDKITAAGEGTNRLTKTSVKVFDPVTFGQECTLQVNFNSENNTSAKIGIFDGIRAIDNTSLQVKSVTVCNQTDGAVTALDRMEILK